MALVRPVIAYRVALGGYQAAWALGGWLVERQLDRRTRAGKEDAARRPERAGIAGHSRPPGRVCWVHAASVGEALSVERLIARLIAEHADLSVVLTTGTVTSARLMADRLPDRAVHQFVPLDRPCFVDRFLDAWRPDLVLWVESELWPTMLDALRRRGVPAALVNARMSARSYANWRRVPWLVRPLLATFQAILPWNEASAARFRSLGAAGVGPVGNLKNSSDPPPVDEAALARLSAAGAGRPVWLAASTHAGEDAAVIEAHRHLAAAWPGLLTVVAPRHPGRGAEVADHWTAAGLTAARRSQGALPDTAVAAYIADTMGEMGTLFRLAPVVFVGGSLVAHGGHNPVEPAQLACAIVFGPHMETFDDMADALVAEAAAVRVTSAAELAAAVERLMTDETARAQQVARAAAVARRHRATLERVVAALDPLVRRACGQAA